MSNYVKIGIEKYDEDFTIPYEDNMTLEQFHKAIEKVIGPCKLNISGYEKKKNKKLKEVFKGDNQIFCIENENLGNVIKNSKVNFINNRNSCFRDSFTQSFIHSFAETLVKKEEEWRKKMGLPKAKSFKELGNSKNDGLYKDMLGLLDLINGKIENKDLSPIYNPFHSSNNPPSQGYDSGENYPFDTLDDLSDGSGSTEFGLPGGSIILDFIIDGISGNLGYTTNHEIFINKKTIISDCININVRSFIKCSKCNFSEILVINIGNISIPIYEFLNSFHQVKSFNSLLEYYYKTNYFGKENIKKNVYCKKCKTYNSQFYNTMSALPDILFIDFNLKNYYYNTQLRNDTCEWVLEENISLEKYYDRIYCDSSNIKDCNYELTSFICHSGNSAYGHFINYSKINDKWFLFDDLESDAIEIGDFITVKKSIYGLNVCHCFYEKNILKGYEHYIQKYNEIINKKKINFQQEKIENSNNFIDNKYNERNLEKSEMEIINNNENLMINIETIENPKIMINDETIPRNIVEKPKNKGIENNSLNSLIVDRIQMDPIENNLFPNVNNLNEKKQEERENSNNFIDNKYNERNLETSKKEIINNNENGIFEDKNYNNNKLNEVLTGDRLRSVVSNDKIKFSKKEKKISCTCTLF